MSPSPEFVEPPQDPPPSDKAPPVVNMSGRPSSEMSVRMEEQRTEATKSYVPSVTITRAGSRQLGKTGETEKLANDSSSEKLASDKDDAKADNPKTVLDALTKLLGKNDRQTFGDGGYVAREKDGSFTIRSENDLYTISADGKKAEGRNVKGQLLERLAGQLRETLVVQPSVNKDGQLVLNVISKPTDLEVDVVKEMNTPDGQTISPHSAEALNADNYSKKITIGQDGMRINPISGQSPEFMALRDKVLNMQIMRTNSNAYPNLTDLEVFYPSSDSQGNGVQFIVKNQDGSKVVRMPISDKPNTDVLLSDGKTTMKIDSNGDKFTMSRDGKTWMVSLPRYDLDGSRFLWDSVDHGTETAGLTTREAGDTEAKFTPFNQAPERPKISPSPDLFEPSHRNSGNGNYVFPDGTLINFHDIDGISMQLPLGRDGKMARIEGFKGLNGRFNGATYDPSTSK